MAKAKQPQHHRAACDVKARIIRAGVKLTDLAAAAKVSQPTLSRYIHGEGRVYLKQALIYAAFCDLTGRTATPIGISRFWGSLLARRVA